MIEFIIILGFVAVAGLITRELLDEKRMVEAFDKAMAIHEAEKEELVPFDFGAEDEEEKWYLYLDFCSICDDVIFEDEVIVHFPEDDGTYMTACEYCLNPDLKDE